MQALILAAGRGSRLGGSGYDQPKCLLEIGRRRLIEHQLDALSDAGIGPVHLVLGYAADEIREVVGMRAEYVVNTRWSHTNSLYSFWAAREVIKGDVMVLNCDVLFGAEILDRLLDQPGDAVAIDSSSGDGREQMKVRVLDGKLAAMSKEMPGDQATGENVGIFKLTGDTASAMFDTAGRLIEAGHEKSWVGAAVTEIARGRDMHAVDVAGIPWIEIDFPVDLARARAEVWPAIGGANRRVQRMWRTAVALAAVGALGSALFLGARWKEASTVPIDWESVLIEGSERIRVDVGDRKQSWWSIDASSSARTVVTGPAPVRVESRLLDVRDDREPYVLELRLDGKRIDWFKLTTRPSGKARHPTWIVGHKKRVTIEVPEGSHELEIGLVAPEDARCLVRVRQREEDPED